MRILMGIRRKRRKESPKNPEPILPDFPEVNALDRISVIRSEEFFQYFVYSNKEHRVIGSIYLTEDQASRLNKIMQSRGVYKQDIAFLIKA